MKWQGDPIDLEDGRVYVGVDDSGERFAVLGATIRRIMSQPSLSGEPLPSEEEADTGVGEDSPKAGAVRGPSVQSGEGQIALLGTSETSPTSSTPPWVWLLERQLVTQERGDGTVTGHGAKPVLVCVVSAAQWGDLATLVLATAPEGTGAALSTGALRSGVIVMRRGN